MRKTGAWTVRIAWIVLVVASIPIVLDYVEHLLTDSWAWYAGALLMCAVSSVWRAERRTSRIIPAILLTGILVYDAIAARKAVPPPHVKTLSSFLDWRPGPHYGYVKRIQNRDHLVVLGDFAGMIPSGPAAYVFDKSGRLLDWTVDSGDDHDFQQKWQPSELHVEVDRDFAAQWVVEQ